MFAIAPKHRFGKGFFKTSLLLAAGIVPLPFIRAADEIYPTKPDWTSIDTFVSTGAALRDLNLDGWPDLIVSNGNDISRQRLVVYYNKGDGTFPTKPDWQSDDTVYFGHLDVADVNADGYPDVAVAALLNENGPAARLYLNNGGTLSKKADWKSDEKSRSFAVAFGDMNSDGRPDLAVITGWPYQSGYAAPEHVHLNVDGALETTASWKSDDKYDFMNLVWLDADADGWLDLLCVGANNANYLYRNTGGTLETKPSWHTTNNDRPFGLMADFGDIDGDRRPDLFVADNTQVFEGNGNIQQFRGLEAGDFETDPSWKFFTNYGSAVALADLNRDGRLDMTCGAWWDNTRLFLNRDGALPDKPDWKSAGTSVVEKIVFGDVNNDGLRQKTVTGITAQLVFLPNRPIERILEVQIDSEPVTANEYLVNYEHGWLTLARKPESAAQITYLYSVTPELAISNWDSNVGNQLWFHRGVLRGDANCDDRIDFDDIDAFVLWLTSPDDYGAAYPWCRGNIVCDVNADGNANFDDIDGFVELLTR